MEVIEVVDNSNGRILFTLKEGKDQDYTLIDENGFVVRSVSVYATHDDVWK